MCSGVLSEDASTCSRWGVAPGDEGGGAQARKVVGLTKDSTGAALPSCVVQAFLTSSNVNRSEVEDTFLGQVTSDLGGYYELCLPVAANVYLVAYKVGSPDLAGTTVNTIAPT